MSENKLSSSTSRVNTKDYSHLERELHLSLEENARLRNALVEEKMKLAAATQDNSAYTFSQLTNPYLVKELLDELDPLVAALTKSTSLLSIQLGEPLSLAQVRSIKRVGRSVEKIRSLMAHYQQKSSLPSSPCDSEGSHISLSRIVQNQISQNHCLLEQKQITLQMLIPDSLPEVMGAPQEIFNIIEAVFINAVEITPPQEIIQISMDIEKSNLNHWVVLTVSDHGPGIPAVLLPNLFTTGDDQPIPGCTLTRFQLTALNQSVQNQGGLLKIENCDPVGSIFKLSFLPAVIV
jgi:signal transduction histidine kinase